MWQRGHCDEYQNGKIILDYWWTQYNYKVSSKTEGNVMTEKSKPLKVLLSTVKTEEGALNQIMQGALKLEKATILPRQEECSPEDSNVIKS